MGRGNGLSWMIIVGLIIPVDVLCYVVFVLRFTMPCRAFEGLVSDEHMSLLQSGLLGLSRFAVSGFRQYAEPTNLIARTEWKFRECYLSKKGTCASPVS